MMVALAARILDSTHGKETQISYANYLSAQGLPQRTRDYILDKPVGL